MGLHPSTCGATISHLNMDDFRRTPARIGKPEPQHRDQIRVTFDRERFVELHLDFILIDKRGNAPRHERLAFQPRWRILMAAADANAITDTQRSAEPPLVICGDRNGRDYSSRGSQNPNGD